MNGATPPTAVIGVECRCRRRVPIRASRAAQQFFRGLPIPPALVIETYRCGACKQVVVIRAVDLGFTRDGGG